MKPSTLEYLMTGLRAQASAIEEHLKAEGEIAASKMVGMAWKALKEASDFLHERDVQVAKIQEEEKREEEINNGQFGVGA